MLLYSMFPFKKENLFRLVELRVKQSLPVVMPS